VKSKPKTEQYNTFEDALKKVLTVSHSEMKAKLEAEKKKRPKMDRKAR
jgi:hypothetical protein